MSQLAAAVAAPDQIAHMDAAARTAGGSDYKQRLMASLDVRQGQTVVDIGCGPGTDLARLADAVGEGGSVIGVDREPRMLDEAHRRLAHRPNVELMLDQILGLRRNAARAVQAGMMSEADAEPWLQRLARGPVVAGFTCHLVVAES